MIAHSANDLAAFARDRGDGASRLERPGGDDVPPPSAPLCRAQAQKPRRRWNTPSGARLRERIASLPKARPTSWPMMIPPIAGETTASTTFAQHWQELPANHPLRPARAARAGFISTRAHCR